MIVDVSSYRVDDIAWNKDPVLTKIEEVCYYCARNYLLCKFCERYNKLLYCRQNLRQYHERRMPKGEDNADYFIYIFYRLKQGNL